MSRAPVAVAVVHLADRPTLASRLVCVLMDSNRDGAPERSPCFGNPGDIYLVGDWDGDGDDNLAVVRPGAGGCIPMDTDDAGGAAELTRCYGNGL